MESLLAGLRCLVQAKVIWLAFYLSHPVNVCWSLRVGCPAVGGSGLWRGEQPALRVHLFTQCRENPCELHLHYIALCSMISSGQNENELLFWFAFFWTQKWTFDEYWLSDWVLGLLGSIMTKKHHKMCFNVVVFSRFQVPVHFKCMKKQTLVP